MKSDTEALSNSGRGWLSSALTVGWLAAASLVGWLEEVARIQAIQQHFGLPLSASADPRGAAAFALPATAAIVAEAMLIVALVVASGYQPLVAAVFAAASAAFIFAPQHSLLRLLVCLIGIVVVGVVALTYAELHLDAANARLKQMGMSAVRRAVALINGQGALRGAIYARLFRVVAGAVGVIVAALVPLAVGDRIGTNDADTRTDFYVIADRACSPNQVVIDFANDATARTVRVAQRSGAAGRWVLLPGIFSVPVSEPMVRARVGRVAPSAVPRPPFDATPVLPPICTA